MLPVIIAAARAYAPWIVFPFAIVVGGVGYMIEGAVSDKHTPWNKSAIGKIYLASICAQSLDTFINVTFMYLQIYFRKAPRTAFGGEQQQLYNKFRANYG